MKKLSIIIITTILFSLVISINPISANARSFSSTGYDEIYKAAGNSFTGSGLTRNELTAMMLAMTWPETGAGTGTPSPMTLSRGDNSSGLWSFKNKSSTNNERRAFWHPGIGVFQLDSAGMGKDLGIHQRINIATAAPTVANHIATTYKNSSATTKSGKRAAAWKAWYACDNGSCETIFNNIYSATNDTVTVTKDTSVSTTGGMSTRSCADIVTPNTRFTCYEINPNNAQGFTGWRSWTPLDGSLTGNTSPISLQFISFVRNSKEERHWLKERTGYSRDIHATRPMGYNARTNLSWYGVRNICVDGYCGDGPQPLKQEELK